MLRLLSQFHAEDAATQGYGPANVISLLKALRSHQRGLDLSRLSIRRAYLQGVEMQNVAVVSSECLDEPGNVLLLLHLECRQLEPRNPAFGAGF